MKFNIGDKVKINMPDEPINCPGIYDGLVGTIVNISSFYNEMFYIVNLLPKEGLNKIDKMKFGDCHFNEENLTLWQ